MSSSSRARGHLKHATWCSCGKVVHGNGARAAHRKMHERKKDGHYGMIWHEWELQFRGIKTGSESPR